MYQQSFPTPYGMNLTPAANNEVFIVIFLNEGCMLVISVWND
jgi:hypothetical protein